MKKTSRIGLAVACAAGLCSAAIFGMLLLKNKKQEEPISYRETSTSVASAADPVSGTWAEADSLSLSVSPADTEGQDDESWVGKVYRNGQTYTLNRNLETILFLGVDDAYVSTEGAELGNNGRADAIYLLILDKDARKMTILSISRDTMMDIDYYDKLGDYVSSGTNHLNLQYAFTGGNTQSCRLMVKKVGELLYGIQIDGYLALTMDGISVLTDTLGGVPVTFTEDYTELDESFTAGATVTLDGEQAEIFVRARDCAEVGSAEVRTARQKVFLPALISRMKTSLTSKSAAISYWETLEPYVTSDLDADTLYSFRDCQLSEEMYAVPGSVTEGEFHDEFYVDETALQDLIIDLFYVPVS